ncbi:MAG: alkaline phosphatase family protein, partial [Proteobacteria bacterium]|nr:alkaline phosphatase family protein [Pseudomonadota bacterium]
LNPLRMVLPTFIKEKFVPVPRLLRKVERSVVDWSATKAYGSDYGIRINLKGRETTGVVEPGEEYEKVRDAIIEELKGLKDPKTGKKIVDEVWKREELYNGPFFESAPDIMYILDGMNIIQYDFYYFKEHFKNFEHGTHRMNGMFLIKGPGIKEGTELKGAEIKDVAPTLFYSMGEAIPDDMDGKLLSAAYKSEFTQAWPVSYCTALPLLRENINDQSVYSKEEEDEIKKGLQGLGYWG